MNIRHSIDQTYTRSDYLIDEYLEQGHSWGLHRIDPRIKLALLITAISLNVVIARITVSFPLFIIALCLAAWSRIPVKLFALFFLAPAWATLMVFLGFTAGFGETVLGRFGPLTFYREGMLMGVNAATRISSEMSWMAVFFLTTPFPKVLETLRWYKIPGVLVDTIALAYRYAFLLLDEFFNMRDAARSRGGFRSFKEINKSSAMIISQILLRAYDRSINIQNAMIARGANAKKTDAPKSHTLDEDDHDHTCPNRCDITPEYEDASLPVLSCSNLSFSYNERPVLKNIFLSMEKGEVVALCGPNGTGKTTLMKILIGLLIPDTGNIRICDLTLTKKTRNEIFRYAGFLSQDSNEQLFGTNVYEDIAYGPRNLGLDEDEVNRLTNTAMELTSVIHLANRPIHRLSHGEMKRVGLAGLLAMRPPLIFLDEPAAGLDPVSKKQFVELIEHLNSHHGYTFMIVTHDIDLAADIASRLVILKNGEILADGSLRDVLSNPGLLQEAHLEPPILTRFFQRIKPETPDPFPFPITLEEAVKAVDYIKNHSEKNEN